MGTEEGLSRLADQLVSQEAFESVVRLRAWLRDYGHEKQPAFVEDLDMVLLYAERQLFDSPLERWLEEREHEASQKMSACGIQNEGYWFGKSDAYREVLDWIRTHGVEPTTGEGE